jgi:hypothetical protein
MPTHLFARIVLLALLPWLAGCAARVIPPEPPREPRSVQLLEHGRHSTLLLTAADQTRVRYAYADWAWYVEGERGLGAGARALLRPSRSALGRQVVAPYQQGERLESVVGVGVGQRYAFDAEAERVDALLDTLDRLFQSAEGEPGFSPEMNLHFVQHPRPYTYAYNSNHMVADWLRELGFEVHGDPANGGWRVDR